MNAIGEPAAPSPEMIDRICEAVIARLAVKNWGDLPSKQGVAGSNPVSRSKSIHP